MGKDATELEPGSCSVVCHNAVGALYPMQYMQCTVNRSPPNSVELPAAARGSSVHCGPVAPHQVQDYEWVRTVQRVDAALLGLCCRRFNTDCERCFCGADLDASIP